MKRKPDFVTTMDCGERLEVYGWPLPPEQQENPAGCNHWPGQARCGVCGMGYKSTERRS